MTDSSEDTADVESLRLLEAFPTPLVVHDAAVLRHRAAALQRVLPEGSTLLYSLKANPLPPVVAALQAAGCGSEVSSLGELAVAVGTAVPDRPLFFTGPGKSVPEMTAAVAAGALLACESAAEVDRARDALRPLGTRPLEVVLRVQPAARSAAGLSMSDGRQFGVGEDEAVRLCRRPPDGVEVVGFHCYAGSQLPGREALLAAFTEAVELVGRVAAAGGVRPRIADLGGGFPWPYAAPGAGPDLAPLAADLDRLTAPLRERGCEVWFESGRSLVAPAGRLLTTVMDVKERGDRTVVVVDAGVNVLGGMSGLGRVLRPATVLRNLTAPAGPELAVDVVGPLCTPLDRLASNTAVATPRPGDVLCVDNVGAYATTAALAPFLSRPPAVELVTDGGRVVEAWRLATGHVPVPLGAAQEPVLSTRKPM